MKYMFWSFGLIMAGIIGIVFIVMFQSITVNNESEYYVLKEAMEAAMLESVDIACYRNKDAEGCGEVIKISEQKFVENFTRRFLASVGGNATQYTIEFYDIIESPPKASVVIKGRTQQYSIMASESDGSFDIVNSLDGILTYDHVPSESEVSPDAKIILNKASVPDFSTSVIEKVIQDVVDAEKCENMWSTSADENNC